MEMFCQHMAEVDYFTVFLLTFLCSHTTTCKISIQNKQLELAVFRTNLEETTVYCDMLEILLEKTKQCEQHRDARK